MENPDNRVMYYLKDGPESAEQRAFVSEKLMLIPADTELLLITFRNGNIYPSWINITCGLFYFFQPHSAVSLPASWIY